MRGLGSRAPVQLPGDVHLQPLPTVSRQQAPVQSREGRVFTATAHRRSRAQARALARSQARALARSRALALCVRWILFTAARLPNVLHALYKAPIPYYRTPARYTTLLHYFAITTERLLHVLPLPRELARDGVLFSARLLRASPPGAKGVVEGSHALPPPGGVGVDDPVKVEPEAEDEAILL